MKFLFSAPFNSSIKFDQSKIAINTEEFLHHIHHISNQLSRIFVDEFKVSSSRYIKKSEQKFSGMYDDDIPTSYCDVISLVFEPALYSAIETLLVNSYPNPSKKDLDIRVISCRMAVYPNAIGIITLLVDMGPSKINAEINTVDEWSRVGLNKLVEYFTKYTNKISQLCSESKKSDCFLLNTESTSLLFTPDKAVPKAFWVGRVMIAEDLESGSEAHILSWLQQSCHDFSLARLKKESLLFYYGNSIVSLTQDKLDLRSLVHIYELCQYMYSYCESLNKLLQLKHNELVIKNRLTKDGLRGLLAIQRELSTIESEWDDVFLGVQGSRSKMLELVCKAWNIEKLRKSVFLKSQSVRQLTDNLINVKRGRIASWIESILMALGGLALIDTCLNLINFLRGNLLLEAEKNGIFIRFSEYSIDLLLPVLIVLIVSVVWFTKSRD